MRSVTAMVAEQGEVNQLVAARGADEPRAEGIIGSSESVKASGFSNFDLSSMALTRYSRRGTYITATSTMAEITAPSDQGPKKPTLTVETTTVAGVPPQDPAAAGNKKLDPNITAELTPTNSTTTTISSPKDAVVSPIANEVSVETSGLITTDTTLSPSSAGTGGEVEVETKENFEIEAAKSEEATDSKETKEDKDDAALKMQQMIVTGSKILLKKHDVAAEAEDDQYTYEEDLFNAEEDVDDDDNAKMSLGETSSVRIVAETSISHCALTSNYLSFL